MWHKYFNFSAYTVPLNPCGHSDISRRKKIIKVLFVGVVSCEVEILCNCL